VKPGENHHTAGTVDRGGRPASTSPHQLAAAAQRLFVENGFEQTSVEDIAAAAGVSRRTFFRYFPTKADVVWVETDAELKRFRASLAADDGTRPLRDVVEDAVIAALHYSPADDEWALQRADLVLNVPAVQAHAAAVYREWRVAIIDHFRTRGETTDNDLFPVAFAHGVSAALLAAHEYWVAHPDTQVEECLRGMIRLMTPTA
jgi:AcrR family transcriptional regulator